MAILTIIPSLNTVGNAFISLLFPNQCLVCKEGESFSQDPICLDCLQHMTPLPIGNRVQELTVNDGIDIALSGWDFGDELRTAIHSLKYEERARVGFFLGELLGDQLQKKPIQELDYLIPVPLHPVKFRDRGFNQARWIADGLGKAVQKPVRTKLMKRIKHTISQTTLDKKERLNNMKKAFKINQDVTDKNIGIVDDVLTTGSTISSMASILKDAGAKTIVALTVATPLEKKDDTYAESV
ncbi:MAG TPA: ComF family protein [Candidatus Marinimicrobia bacterium]|nr:ComF family protein [Candidatus Neomarinimicrobiota bacterium]